MPFIIAGIAAVVALAGGVLAKVDPVTCLTRAVLVFLMGWIAAQLWQVILSHTGQRRSAGTSADTDAKEDLKPAA